MSPLLLPLTERPWGAVFTLLGLAAASLVVGLLALAASRRER